MFNVRAALFCFINSDVQELAPRRQEEDQANVTPDSAVTANSKLDLDNSLLLFQVMSNKDFFKTCNTVHIYPNIVVHMNNSVDVCMSCECTQLCIYLNEGPIWNLLFDRKC